MGSPSVISKIAQIPQNFSENVDKLSATGARIIAVASGDNEKLICRGLIALADSPRSDARESIAKIKELGIRIIMVTGDTISTARIIAQEVGIGCRIGTLDDALTNPLEFDGFANVFPEEKHKIVQSLQKLGMIVGMTGDGINDAPALKQADVGMAVSNATDIAKSAAKIVLTESRLSDITKVIESGHRVYRRMMTWTITKLTRTAELASLLTLGFIFTGFFPVSLNLIVFIVVMNDLVTLSLGTDKAWPTKVPEQWNLPRLAKISAIFTLVWLVIGLGLLLFFHLTRNIEAAQISTLMFLYLIYSAMATVIMTRTRDQFWSFLPSKWVGCMVVANIIISTLMALAGWLMSPVDFQSVLIVFVITTLVLFVLDNIKIKYYKLTGILGT